MKLKKPWMIFSKTGENVQISLYNETTSIINKKEIL